MTHTRPPERIALPASTGDAKQTSPGGRLDSWKDIAVYLNRGIRTVQRWEREEGLPVHRLRHEKLSSVFAYQEELEAWREARCSGCERQAPQTVCAGRSIAVLPLVDLRREKDQDYLCEGVAEEITNALSRIEGLQVVSRTSAFRFKHLDADVRHIAQQLRVRTLLEGSVRQCGERLRISVRLTDAESGYTTWSETYDRPPSDIFAIQEEIAREVVRTLELTLSPGESSALGRAPTKDAQAFDCYLRARKYYWRYRLRDIECALQLFTRAIGFDPAYPRAYAGLADCWVYIYLYRERSDAVRDQADWASARAVELDPGCAQAHASRGAVLSLSGRDEQAEDAFAAAVLLDPRLFEAQYFFAHYCFVRGQLEKAAKLYEEAMRLRPEDWQAPMLVAQIYDALAQPDRARVARQRGISAAEDHLKLNPDDARALYMAANGMVALGRRDVGREWAERALAMQPDDPMLLYSVGCIYSMLGSTEKALNFLEEAVRSGFTERGWFEHDSNLDALRPHPRFRALLDQLP